MGIYQQAIYMLFIHSTNRWLLNMLITFEYVKLFSKMGFDELVSTEVFKKHKITFFK